jgi:creatinine amidohydrolase
LNVFTVCAMAIGSIEKHGQHLPLGTDTLKGGKILELASEREEVCVFPPLFFGDLQGVQANRAGEGAHYGYVALSSELLLSLLREICDEIGRNGFTKILLFSSHGGNNAFLQNFARAVTSTKKSYEVFIFYNKLIMPKDILGVIHERGRDYFPNLTDEDVAVLEDYVAKGKFDGHAGFGETAMVMGTYPELVRLDRAEAESGMSTHIADPITEQGLFWGKAWYRNFPNAYSGHTPIGCSHAIGEAAVEIAVERTVKVLKLLKNDEVMNKIII